MSGTAVVKYTEEWGHMRVELGNPDRQCLWFGRVSWKRRIWNVLYYLQPFSFVHWIILGFSCTDLFAWTFGYTTAKDIAKSWCKFKAAKKKKKTPTHQSALHWTMIVTQRKKNLLTVEREREVILHLKCVWNLRQGCTVCWCKWVFLVSDAAVAAQQYRQTDTTRDKWKWTDCAGIEPDYKAITLLWNKILKGSVNKVKVPMKFKYGN